MEKLKAILKKEIFFEKTSPEHHNNKFKTEEETREKGEYEGSIIVFDDILEYNQKTIDPFFARGHHTDLDFYYLSPLYFDLSNRTKRNASNINILFN